MKTLLAQIAPPSTPADPNTESPTTLPLHSSIEDVMEQLGVEETWRDTEWWGWVALLGWIFAGVLAGRIASGLLRKAAARAQNRGALAAATVIRSAATPASLFLITVGISIGLGFIDLQPVASTLRNKILTFLYVLAVGWFLFNLVDLIDIWLKNLATRTQSHLDDQLAPLIRKTLRIFLVILIGLYIAQNVFNQDITTWLAGLGIAGLAVSLAAQDSIKNLFGSITILLDKPFAVGERIVFESFDGTVEEIGFRSTRVRLLNGEIATIPNSRFIDNSVRNVSRRPSLPKTLELQLSAETSAADVLRAVERLRAILAEPGLREPFDWEKSPPKVYFDELRGDVRVIHIGYSFSPIDWWAYNDHLQKLQLRILTVLEEMDIDFGGVKTTLVGDPDQPVAVFMTNPTSPPASPPAGSR